MCRAFEIPDTARKLHDAAMKKTIASRLSAMEWIWSQRDCEFCFVLKMQCVSRQIEPAHKESDRCNVEAFPT